MVVGESEEVDGAGSERRGARGEVFWKESPAPWTFKRYAEGRPTHPSPCFNPSKDTTPPAPPPTRRRRVRSPGGEGEASAAKGGRVEGLGRPALPGAGSRTGPRSSDSLHHQPRPLIKFGLESLLTTPRFPSSFPDTHPQPPSSARTAPSSRFDASDLGTRGRHARSSPPGFAPERISTFPSHESHTRLDTIHSERVRSPPPHTHVTRSRTRQGPSRPAGGRHGSGPTPPRRGTAATGTP